MKDYVILTDSSCDLSEEFATENNVLYLPLQFLSGDTSYNNYLDNRELPIKDFYSRLTAGEVFKTNAVNAETFLKLYKEIIKTGKDILVLAFSSGLSATYSSAMIAKNMYQETNKEAKILVVDTLAASSGEGLLVHLAVEQKKLGKSIEEVAAFAENIKLKICHWFTVDNLDTLRRGGRVTASAAFIANALRIKPVMHVDNEGHLIAMSKVLGRKTSIRSLLDEMDKRYIPEYKDVFISHGDCIEDAEYLKTKIVEKYPDVNVSIFYVGPVIGSHSGKGTLALFFVGNER